MELRTAHGPERILQNAWIAYFELRAWTVIQTHGNMYQSGLPDLFVCHTSFGHRWCEIKLPEMKGSKYTPAQMETFPKLCRGSGVWVLTSVNDTEYKKLWLPPNWTDYLLLLKRQCR